MASSQQGNPRIDSASQKPLSHVKNIAYQIERAGFIGKLIAPITNDETKSDEKCSFYETPYFRYQTKAQKDAGLSLVQFKRSGF